MAQITKLSSSSLSFVSKLTTNNTSRAMSTSIALGRTLSNSLTLPSSPVDNPLQYFKIQNQLNLESLISTINEIVIIDTNAVLDYATKFYEYRYASVHPTPHVIALNKQSAIADFFSISKHFSKECLSVIESNPVFMTDLVNNFKNMIAELTAGEDSYVAQ